MLFHTRSIAGLLEDSLFEWLIVVEWKEPEDDANFSFFTVRFRNSGILDFKIANAFD